MAKTKINDCVSAKIDWLAKNEPNLTQKQRVGKAEGMCRAANKPSQYSKPKGK